MSLAVESLMSVLRPSQVSIPEGSAFSTIAPHLVIVSDGSSVLDEVVVRSAETQGMPGGGEFERLGRQVSVLVETPVGNKLTAVSHLRMRAALRHAGACLAVDVERLESDLHLQETARRYLAQSRSVYLYGRNLQVDAVAHLLGLASLLAGGGFATGAEGCDVLGFAVSGQVTRVRRARLGASRTQRPAEMLSQIIAWEYQETYQVHKPIQGTHSA